MSQLSSALESGFHGIPGSSHAGPKSPDFRLSLVAMTMALAAVATSASAQVYGPHFTATPYLGYSMFGKHVNLEDKIAFGGRVGFFPVRMLGIEAHYGMLSTESMHGSPIFVADRVANRAPVTADLRTYGVDVIVHLIPDGAIVPFVLAGWQESKFERDPDGAIQNEHPTYENGPEIGAGVKFRASPRVALRADVRDQIWTFNSPPADDPPADKMNHNLMLSAGIEFALGGSVILPDADGDGIGDKKDRCPDTPLGARVDADGCPIDGDSDGVPDGIDQCGGTPIGARVDSRGCPADSDSDGVYDGLDQCEGTPAGATVDGRGCPADSDGDGVFDGIDLCASTPAGASVDATGCPLDSDGDGVVDGVDRCPNTPRNVRVDVEGCPIEVSERETELLDTGKITVRDINFETAKSTILPVSYKVLDEIGTILVQWPQLRIEIGGHADARGSDSYNLELSEKRAGAVLEYLLSKFPGIDRAQYTSKGYGESAPVATNNTVEGMAANRRVEFKVLNTEVLKKEQERRKLLTK